MIALLLSLLAGSPAAAQSQPVPAIQAAATPEFSGQVQPLNEADRARMTGVSWREGCPTPLASLRKLTFSRWTSEGTLATGELIVAESAAHDVLSVFQTLYEAKFPVHSAKTIDAYNGSDDASMADNNTSAFNCRKVGGTTRWSEHASGLALDLNPLQNPMVKGSRVYPPEGKNWLDRADVRPGMITDGDVAVKAFAAIGWKWGGHWNSLKDYQHFSKSGH